MISVLSNKKLGLAFLVLLIIAAIIFLTDQGSNERSFRTELVSIDTSKVSQIIIYPRQADTDKIKLYQEEDEWKVELSNDKSALVPQRKIDDIVNQLANLKPERLAGRGESSWTDFEVDTSATRVEVYEGSSRTLDLVIGKFTFQQPRAMKTFVRLANDTDVYEVDGFLSMTFNQNRDSFRDATVIKGDINNWKSISYSYPADSSYQLVKVNDSWQFSNGVRVDSAKTSVKLRQLANISGNEFLDVNKSELPLPQYKLTIISNDDSQIEVFGYKTENELIVNSSLNPDSYFNGRKNDLFNKVFVGSKEFVGK
ncbi:MAG: DUF4340 domain-containing protein [Melioribacteraceae bacterium]|nr:DUF4340 domain-containing protein [Melioribacteraceae bacterium]